MALVRRTPYKELLDMPREMTSLFGRPFRSLLAEPFLGVDALRVPMDIYSKGADMFMRMELPGIKAEDVDITLADHMLSITGKREEDKEIKEDDFYRRERTFGSFERSVPLPDKVTEKDIEAVFEDGVLEIKVKGAVETVPAKHIEVKGSKPKGKHIRARKAG
ncbi:MAG: Hsp20/alpha crystallin family protein [Thermoleophilia bacterium]